MVILKLILEYPLRVNFVRRLRNSKFQEIYRCAMCECIAEATVVELMKSTNGLSKVSYYFMLNNKVYNSIFVLSIIFYFDITLIDPPPTQLISVK